MTRIYGKCEICKKKTWVNWKPGEPVIDTFRCKEHREDTDPEPEVQPRCNCGSFGSSSLDGLCFRCHDIKELEQRISTLIKSNQDYRSEVANLQRKLNDLNKKVEFPYRVIIHGWEGKMTLERLNQLLNDTRDLRRLIKIDFTYIG